MIIFVGLIQKFYNQLLSKTLRSCFSFIGLKVTLIASSNRFCSLLFLSSRRLSPKIAMPIRNAILPATVDYSFSSFLRLFSLMGTISINNTTGYDHMIMKIKEKNPSLSNVKAGGW